MFIWIKLKHLINNLIRDLMYIGGEKSRLSPARGCPHHFAHPLAALLHSSQTIGICNRARDKAEPETLRQQFHVKWWNERPIDSRFNPAELYPKNRAYAVRNRSGERGLDFMSWDVLGGGAARPMTNFHNLTLPQWPALASNTARRCLIPMTEFGG